MKKHAVALFAGLLILAIAAPLFAETYIDGMVFYRPRIYKNTDFLGNNPSVNDERILPILALGAGYKAEDYAEAYFKLFTLGHGNALGVGYGGTQTDGSEIYHEFALTQAWFDVKIPYTPVHWRVGRYAQSLGHGFYYNTGAYGGDGMKLWAPIGPVRIDLGYTKMNESYHFSEDIDQYYLQVAGSVAEKTQISGAFQWFEGRNISVKNLPKRGQYQDITHVFTVWDPYVEADSHIWTLGVAADGAAGIVSYRAEAVYAGGKLVDDIVFDPDQEFADGIAKDVSKTDLAREESISGFALLAGATVAPIPQVTVTVEGAYGSGDKRQRVVSNWDEIDTDPTDPMLGFNSKRVRNVGSGGRYEGFKVPMAQWGRSVWFDEYSFYPGSFTGDPFDFAGPFGLGVNKNQGGSKYTAAWTQRGLENLMYLTVGATYTPVTPLTLGIDVFKLWATQATPKGGFDPDSRILFKKKQSKDLGWEVDLTAKWTLNKNFAVTGAFAPWWPGSYFKVPKGSRVLVTEEDEELNLYDTDTYHWKEIPKTSDPEWGWIARANCVFTF